MISIQDCLTLKVITKENLVNLLLVCKKPQLEGLLCVTKLWFMPFDHRRAFLRILVNENFLNNRIKPGYYLLADKGMEFLHEHYCMRIGFSLTRCWCGRIQKEFEQLYLEDWETADKKMFNRYKSIYNSFIANPSFSELRYLGPKLGE